VSEPVRIEIPLVDSRNVEIQFMAALSELVDRFLAKGISEDELCRAVDWLQAGHGSVRT